MAFKNPVSIFNLKKMRGLEYLNYDGFEDEPKFKKLKKDSKKREKIKKFKDEEVYSKQYKKK